MKTLIKITIALAFTAGLVMNSGSSASLAAPGAELAALDPQGQVVMRTMPPDPPKPDRPKPKREKPLFPLTVPPSAEGEAAV